MVLAGVSVLLGVTMAVYWGTRRGHPGFGLWTICSALLAATFLAAADRAHLPEFATVIVIPGLLILGAIMRLEGLRRFLGRRRLDYRTLLVPVVAAALIAYLVYGRDNPYAEITVTACVIALVFWAMAAVIILKARGSDRVSHRVYGALFIVFGGLLLSYPFFWSPRSEGSLLPEVNAFSLTFFVLVVLFEVTWVIVFLGMGTGRTAGTLEAARSVAESGRRQLADIVAFLPDATFVIDSDRRVIAWNRAAEELTGASAEQVAGAQYEQGAYAALGNLEETLADVVLDPTASIPKRYRNVQREGDKLSAETEIEFPGRAGRSYDLWVTATLLRDDAGAVTGAIESMRDITEQVEARRILQQSEARLLEAQAVSHVGNWEIDLVAQSIWLSPEALRIHGIENTSSYFPLDMASIAYLAEEPDRLAAAIEGAMTGGGSCDVEYRVKRMNDGASRTLHLVGKTQCDETGAPTKVAGIIQDVTGLGRVEEALKIAQSSVDHAADHVFWVTRDGRFFYVNDSTCKQLGYSREELLGMKIFNTDPKAADRWDEEWERVKREGSITREGVCHTKDGTVIPTEVSVNYIVHEGQEYHFVFARDITTRKRVEESLDRNKVSLDHAGDQVFWVGPEGRFAFVSDATCRQLGYTREELLNMTVHDIDPTETRDWDELWEEVKLQGPRVFEGTHRTKDGRDIPVEVNANYIQHDGQEYELVFARDISERKRTEDEHEAAEDRIRQSQTMEAIGQLAGGIAHDFNNLLTAIIGYGSLILSNEEVQGMSVQTDAEEIRAAAERASALTHQILAFARRQALRPQVVSLAQFIADMETKLRDALGRDIELVGVQHIEPGFVEVDLKQFEQALMGLVLNARDAMPGGGRLTLEGRNVDLDEEYCRVYPDIHPGRYVVLSLSDTGVGMSPDTLSHVFEPFFTTKRPGAGFGLGLSVVHGIIRQSGGFVNVYSDPGEGTTFRIYLPLVPAPTGTPEKVVPAAQSVRGDETILVAEDEAPLRKLVARVLGNLGYQVVVAGSGPEALEMLGFMESPPDLLLTDVILPGGMRGNELAREMTGMVPGLPVLYMSGHTRDAIVHSGRLDEGVNFLGKPFTPESLAAKVREVLGSSPRPAGSHS